MEPANGVPSAIVATVTITLNNQGGLNVNGPLDKKIMLCMLADAVKAVASGPMVPDSPIVEGKALPPSLLRG